MDPDCNIMSSLVKLFRSSHGPSDLLLGHISWSAAVCSGLSGEKRSKAVTWSPPGSGGWEQLIFLPYSLKCFVRCSGIWVLIVTGHSNSVFLCKLYSFPVNVGLCQGCLLSAVLFIIFMHSFDLKKNLKEPRLQD